MLCLNCGKEMGEGITVCTNCGAKLPTTIIADTEPDTVSIDSVISESATDTATDIRSSSTKKKKLPTWLIILIIILSLAAAAGIGYLVYDLITEDPYSTAADNEEDKEDKGNYNSSDDASSDNSNNSSSSDGVVPPASDSSNNTPSNNTPSNNTPSNNTSSDNTSSDNASSDNASSDNVSSDNASSDNTSSTEPTPVENSIVGTWTGLYDMTDAVKASSGPEMEAYFGDSRLTTNLTFVFGNDGTFEMSMDKELFKSSLKDVMAEVLMAVLEESLEVSGTDMTAQEYLDSMEMTVDEFVAESVDIDAMVDEMDAGSSGQYLFEDNKLYTYATGEQLDRSTYQVCQISGNTLTMIEQVGEGAEEANLYMFPLTLNKA